MPQQMRHNLPRKPAPYHSYGLQQDRTHESRDDRRACNKYRTCRRESIELCRRLQNGEQKLELRLVGKIASPQQTQPAEETWAGGGGIAQDVGAQDWF